MEAFLSPNSHLRISRHSKRYTRIENSVMIDLYRVPNMPMLLPIVSSGVVNCELRLQINQLWTILRLSEILLNWLRQQVILKISRGRWRYDSHLRKEYRYSTDLPTIGRVLERVSIIANDLYYPEKISWIFCIPWKIFWCQDLQKNRRSDTLETWEKTRVNLQKKHLQSHFQVYPLIDHRKRRIFLSFLQRYGHDYLQPSMIFLGYSVRCDSMSIWRHEWSPELWSRFSQYSRPNYQMKPCNDSEKWSWVA